MHNKIDLSTVVLHDDESTMDLFCNPYLVEYIKSKGTFEDKEQWRRNFRQSESKYTWIQQEGVIRHKGYHQRYIA